MDHRGKTRRGARAASGDDDPVARRGQAVHWKYATAELRGGGRSGRAPRFSTRAGDADKLGSCASWHAHVDDHAGARHDPQTQIRRVPTLFAQAGSENGPAPQSRHVLDTRRGGEARARSAILQATLTQCAEAKRPTNELDDEK